MGRKKVEFFIWVLSFLCLVQFSYEFVPIDDYLIDCGSPTNTTVGERVFMSDTSASKFLSSPQNILAYTLKPATSFNDSQLYQTARILTGGTTRYTFPIRQLGRHWIRLYFYPFVYENYNMSSASFDVSVDNYVLLSSFGVNANSNTDSNSVVVKEFLVNITGNSLVIVFNPSGNSFAFVNAIEVVSVPDQLITGEPFVIGNDKEQFVDLHKQALETVARVNMGGGKVTYDNDTLWRTWVADTDFIVEKNLAATASNIGGVKYKPGGATQDIAPQSVYGTLTEMNSKNNPSSNFNVTWEFSVDPGFQYLIRFHFCDVVSLSLNQLYFNLYVDSWLAFKDVDLSSYVKTLATAYYIDFVTSSKETDKMRVSIGPSKLNIDYPNAILNGLEIMKMNTSSGSLSKGNTNFSRPGSPSKKNVGIIVGVVAVIGIILLILIGGVLFVYRKKRSVPKAHSKTWTVLGETSHTTGSKFSNGTGKGNIDASVAHRMPFAALKEATNTFDENRVVGNGGFGKVYKGVLNDGTKVAVKRGNPQSQQGFTEFQTEIELLSQFRHRHLVSLIGYCDENDEMILVYEYMENGTLKSHLYGSGLPTLSWKQRLEICIGSARGLHYLHTGHAKPVIHRDVKSANILLDESFVSKVADFGLSKTGPELDQTHVSTAVKGSFGYLDPEYFRRQQLTDKSDVYSFGVVLFEVLCARPALDPALPREKVNLTEWAMKWQKKGELSRIIDTTLVGDIKPDSLRKFGETAEKCVAEYGVDRPSMGDVLWNLEYALQLQEAVIEDDIKGDMIGDLPPKIDDISTRVEVSEGNAASSREFDDASSGISMNDVFSQLNVKSEGR